MELNLWIMVRKAEEHFVGLIWVSVWYLDLEFVSGLDRGAFSRVC